MKKKLGTQNSSKIFKKHNHNACFKNAIRAIEKHCLENKIQLTPLRRKVFEFLLKDHRPLGAYQILDLLRKEGFSSTPPIAYRVLDFWIAEGFVHRIKKLNAFVACAEPGTEHSPAFMICRKCKKVAELDEKESKVNLEKTSPTEFIVEEAVIELIGLCKSCITLEAA